MDHGRGSAGAYTIDGQGVVLSVQETSPPPPTPARAEAPPPPRVTDPGDPADVGAGGAAARLGRTGGPDRGRTARSLPGGDPPPDDTTTRKECAMTQTARDDQEITPYDGTRGDGPEGDPPDPTSYTREQGGPAPEDVQWPPLTDPAEIAAIEGALAQGSDPPYDVWVEGAPAALAPGDLTPLEEGPAVYAWEQSGPASGEGQLYEITDPVVLAAYAEAHPAPSGIEIANPAAYYEAAAAPEPILVVDLDRDLTPALDL